MSRILSTAIAVPPHALDRQTYKRYCEAVFASHARAARHVIDQTLIDTRYISRPPEELLAPRSLDEKSTDYARVARALCRDTAARALDRAGVRPQEIDLFVTTSCTGVMIPSVDAYLVDEMGMRPDVVRLPITELGCAGGAAALARAREHLMAYPAHVALVIGVELPSLTWQRTDLSMTNLVATSIFGDGAAACVLANRKGPRPSPRLVDSRTHLYPHTQDLMGFDLKDGGFHIVLSREVPERLRGQVRPLVEALLAAHALSLGDIKFVALHPGGRRILENVEQELGVRGLTQPSWDVLRRYGNLSSATVLFVLDALVGRPPAIEPGDYGLLAAFGPGFSCELSLLRWDA